MFARNFILLTSLLVFITSCKTSKIQSDSTNDRVEEIRFKVVSAYITHWDGAIEGAKGDKITITLVGNKANEVIPDSVWYGGDKGFRSVFQTRKDTLIISGNYSGSEKVKIIDLETGNTKAGVIKVTPPVNYTGAALMRFYISGESKYQVIDELTEKK